MIEFVCCECGTHVTSVIPDKAPEPPLCALCLYLPSWFEDPVLRDALGFELLHKVLRRLP